MPTIQFRVSRSGAELVSRAINNLSNCNSVVTFSKNDIPFPTNIRPDAKLYCMDFYTQDSPVTQELMLQIRWMPDGSEITFDLCNIRGLIPVLLMENIVLTRRDHTDNKVHYLDMNKWIQITFIEEKKQFAQEFLVKFKAEYDKQQADKQRYMAERAGKVDSIKALFREEIKKFCGLEIEPDLISDRQCQFNLDLGNGTVLHANGTIYNGVGEDKVSFTCGQEPLGITIHKCLMGI